MGRDYGFDFIYDLSNTCFTYPQETELTMISKRLIKHMS